MRFRTRTGLAALLCTVLLAPLAAAQDHDKLLPESTIFYLSIENASRTTERFQTSALKGLWTDPAMKAFLEKPTKAWTDLMRKQKEEDGFSIADVLDMVTGQAVLAIVGLDESDDPRLVALVDVGDKADKVKEIVAQAEKSLLEDGKVRREEEEFAGATIVRYTRDEEEAPAADGPNCWFVAKGLFGAADDIEDLKRVLVRRDEAGEGSLAAREIYTGVRRRLGGRTDFFAYFDVRNLIGQLAEAEVIDEDDQRIMGALGVLNVDAVAAQFTLEPNALDLQLFIPLNGPKKGILKIWDGTPGNLVPPRFIPPDAAGAGVMMLDLNALWQEAIRVANEIEPGSGMMMEGFLQMARAQIGLDPKAVLAALGDEIAYFAKLVDPDEPGAQIPVGPGMGMMDIPRFAVAFTVRDKDALDREMNNMVAALGEAVKELDYLGVKIRYFEGAAGMEPALAVLPDRFVFALHLEDAKEIVNRYGKDIKGIADQPAFTRAMENLPAQRTMVAFGDDARGLHHTLSGFSGIFGGMLGGGPALFEKALLPPLEVFQKYLDVGGAALVNEERAVYYRARTGLKSVAKKPADEDGGGDEGDEGGSEESGEDDGG